MNNEKEIWREYPVEIPFESNFKVEFSNFGRIKTYNRLHPAGKIIKGSSINGYPSFSTKISAPLEAKHQEKIEEFNLQITALNNEIKKIQQENTVSALKQEPLLTTLQQLRKDRDALVQKRKKTNARIRKKIDFNFHVLVHKAVAELFLPKPNKDQKFVIHLDFNNFNNQVENLAWATEKEVQDRSMTSPKTILHQFKKQFSTETKPIPKHSKLSEMDVLHIKEKLNKGATLRQLAKQFGVSDMQIYRIKSGENWSSVKTVRELKEERV